jgi:hypothetical protein
MANGRESEFKFCYGCQQELPFPGTHFFLHFLSSFVMTLLMLPSV